MLERLCQDLGDPIPFVDAGSGGTLKKPWRLLPHGSLVHLAFDGDAGENPGFNICLSDHNGEMPFHVADDERGSSLLAPNPGFIARYGLSSLRTRRTETMRVATLDSVLGDRVGTVEALDVNVEGHDAAVLRGARRVFCEGRVALVKVEFELQSVWQGQSYFADVDTLMRGYGYELSAITVDRMRPAACQAPLFDGEPIWGKAVYAPGNAVLDAWNSRLTGEAFRRQMLVMAILSVAAALPSRAIEALAWAEREGVVEAAAWKQAVLRIWRDEPRRVGARAIWRRLPSPVRRSLAPMIDRLR